MTETNAFILKKFNLPFEEATRMPIEIPNYGRNNLPELLNELGFKLGVEVGVEQGSFSEILCKHNPGVKLFGVDPWKAYRGYRDHVDQVKLDGFYEKTKARMAPYNYVQVRKFSMDAVKDFKDHSIDFVYIDGNHNFQNVTNDIIEWTKKVKIGGIIAGHDYSPQRKPAGNHTFEVVNAYTYCYCIRPWFILGTKAKNPGEIRDDARSYMWVNEEPASLKKNQYNPLRDEMGW